MTVWDIDITESGADIRRDRKAFAYDLDDLDEARARIRRKFKKDDTIRVTELDGYRYKLKV